MSILIFLLLTLFNLHNTDDPAFDIYSKGYMSISNENWSEAIIQFTKLIQMYPKSEYADDSQFWLSYSYKEKMQLENAFDEFKIVIEKYPSSDFVEKAKLERLNIARYLTKKNVERFVSFMKNGGDIADEIIFKYNKVIFFKNRLDDILYIRGQYEAKVNRIARKHINSGLIQSTSREALFMSYGELIENYNNLKSGIERAEFFMNYNKIRLMDNEFTYHQNILNSTRDEIDNLIMVFKPYLNEGDISDLMERNKIINKEFYDACKYIELKKWNEAIVELNKFIAKYADSKMIIYAKFWLAYALKESNQPIQSFIEFENLLKFTNNQHLIQEIKLNRVIIARNLADKGDKKFINFLESGSDYRNELREIMIEIVRNSQTEKTIEIDKLFNLNFVNSNYNSNQNSINKMYHSKLIQNVNSLAGKIKLYYGDFKINVNEIIK